MGGRLTGDPRGLAPAPSDMAAADDHGLAASIAWRIRGA
jgi:hypothetical protein